MYCQKNWENIHIDEDLKQQLCKLLLSSLEEEEIEFSIDLELDVIESNSSNSEINENCKCLNYQCESSNNY